MEFLSEEEKAEKIGYQDKRVVVMVGRFQPPTRGHYKVIDAMKSFIRSNPDLDLDRMPVVVIVAGSKSDSDKKRNPLSGDDRKKFMESSGKANGVTFLIAPNAFAAFTKVREEGMEPIAVACGEDREKDYLKILDKHFRDEDDEPIEHHVISLDRDFDTEKDDGEDYFNMVIDMINNGDEIDDNQISGSLARHAVKNDQLDAFAYIVGLDAKKKLAEKLFDKVKEAIE